MIIAPAPPFVTGRVAAALPAGGEASSDARLFTAAPDLLAACEWGGHADGQDVTGPTLLRDIAADLENLNRDFPSIRGQLTGIIQVIRHKAGLEEAAIAKARGT